MDAMDSEPTSETPEPVDPRQQTLDRFFQQKSQRSTLFRPSREALAPRANETAFTDDYILRRQAFNQMSSVGSASESSSPSSDPMGAEMDMEMDIDSGSGSDGSGQTPQSLVGGMSWR
ncbi:hypothetical protein N7535_000560 [Penicillium sp. DV-2018c]|nr:hypothetical protein N7535_000560 [Penicillium sp. DV-2018c]